MSLVSMRFRFTIVMLALVFVPQLVSAQGRRNGGGMRIGIGVGRFVPLEPLATADGNPTEYRFADGGATILAVDYWFNRWIGTRLSHQWARPELEEPEGPSFVRLRSGYLAALLAPVQIGRTARPYLTMGGGYRRYDVNAPVSDGTDVWNIAGLQNRLAAFAGAGVTLRLGRFQIAPEAGTFINTFRHQFPCQGCSDQKNRQLDMLLSLQLVFG
jgi:hypothetical protein